MKDEFGYEYGHGIPDNMTKCECGLEINDMCMHLHQYCEFSYKVPESNMTINCLKYKDHEGKHYICGMHVND